MKTKSRIFFIFGLAIALFSCSNEEEVSFSNLSVSAISFETAQFRCPLDVENDDVVEETGICWSEDANPGLEDSVIYAVLMNKTITGGVSGLLPNKTYYARAFAKTSEGMKFGKVVSFNTKYYKMNIDTLSTDTTSLRFRVYPTTDYVDLMASFTTTVGMQYGNASHPDSLKTDSVRLTPSYNTFVVRVDSLAPDTYYYYRSYAQTKWGMIYSDIDSVKTKALPAI